jgi:hypothetical protein
MNKLHIRDPSNVWNMSSLQADSAACMFIHRILSKNKKRREKRLWQTQLCRTVYSGARLLEGLKFQEIGGQ